MPRVLKTFLFWLLALALPMQGYAAATMFTCRTTLEHSSHSMNQATHLNEVMNAGGMSHHEHDSARQISDSSLPHPASGKPHHHSSCSTCSVCCVGVAMMPGGLDWQPPYSGAELPSASPAVSFFGHIPSGLDRPPRNILV